MTVFNKVIFLVGMMGSGKSSVGRILSQRWGFPFVDLDQRLEMIYGRSIRELFDAGEESFRERESSALRSLVDEPGFERGPLVVATGGGVIVNSENRALMEKSGLSIYLRVSLKELKRRLHHKKQRDIRPLLASEEDEPSDAPWEESLAALFAERQALYESSTFAVDAEGKLETVADRIEKELRMIQSQRNQ